MYTKLMEKLNKAFGEEYTILSNDEIEITASFELFKGSSETFEVRTVLCVINAWDKYTGQNGAVEYGSNDQYYFDIFRRAVDLPEYIEKTVAFHEFMDKLFNITSVGYKLIELLY